MPAESSTTQRILATIPSPTDSVWHLGPIPIRAYAICIVAGIIVSVWWTDRRWVARGGKPGAIGDMAAWAIVFGILGGRIYHVITDYQLYFGKGRHPIDALKIYQGGLGIWGAIAFGALGAWIGCRRHGMRLVDFADAAIPTIAVAQGIGRIGNWFNNELYGRATDVPWKLQIHCIDVDVGKAQLCDNGSLVQGYYQPTFLYELLWDFALAGVLIWAERRFRLRNGQVFALYAIGYTAGRSWIEALRVDDAHHILGIRLNDWTSLIVFLGGIYFFIRQGRQARARDEDPPGGPPEVSAPEDDPSGEPSDGPSDDARVVSTEVVQRSIDARTVDDERD